MKKTTLLILLLFTAAGFAQQKSTGVVQLLNNTTANLLLNNSTSTATLTLSGPSNRWFALQFGSFGEGNGMMAGADLVYWNGSILVDAVHNGLGITPSTDAVNNWTFVSSTPNMPAAGLTTVVATRPFVGGSGDFTFNYASASIDFAFARNPGTGFTLVQHNGLANAGYSIDTAFDVLDVEDLSLNAAVVFPNPTNGKFTVRTNTPLENINIYTHTGAFVKTIKVNMANEAEVNVEGLQAGVYLIELQNANEKSWKKVIVE